MTVGQSKESVRLTAGGSSQGSKISYSFMKNPSRIFVGGVIAAGSLMLGAQSSAVEAQAQLTLSPRPVVRRPPTLPVALRDLRMSIQDHREALAEFGGLPEGWLGPDSRPISPEALRLGNTIISNLEWLSRMTQSEHLDPTGLAPLENGGIQINWRSPRELLEVVILPSGRYRVILFKDNEIESNEKYGPEREIVPILNALSSLG